MTFRSKLNMIMSEKDLTIQDLSDMLNVSRVSISHWRNGKRTPSTGNLKRMSSLWGISVDSLLDDDQDLKSFLTTETASERWQYNQTLAVVICILTVRGFALGYSFSAPSLY